MRFLKYIRSVLGTCWLYSRLYTQREVTGTFHILNGLVLYEDMRVKKIHDAKIYSFYPVKAAITFAGHPYNIWSGQITRVNFLGPPIKDTE